MITTKRIAFIPDHILPAVRKNDYTNLTNELKIISAHLLDADFIDETVENIIKNPINTLYCSSEYKSFLSIDATLVTSDAQKLKSNLHIIGHKDCSFFKTIEVGKILKPSNKTTEIPSTIKRIIEDAIMFDLLDYSDLIYLPEMGWNKKPQWVSSNIDIRNKSIYLTEKNIKVIDLQSVMYYSNNIELSDEQFFKMKLLFNSDNISMAVNMLNAVNPTKSFVEILVLFNYIPLSYRSKHKKKLLTSLRSIYKTREYEDDLSLHEIESLCNINNIELSLDKQEFIIDNYINRNTEQSSMFKLKITKK